MNKKILTGVKSIACIAGLVLSSIAAADMTGKWSVTVQTEMGAGTPTFDLTEADGKLSGTYTGQMGSQPVSGTVDGENFTLVINVDAQGQSMAMTYTGAVNGDAIEGKLDFGGMGGGTFTGKKQ